MKSFLIGIATMFLYIVVLIMSFDSKIYLEQSKELRFIAQELSATGTLFLDYSGYSRGDIFFSDAEAIQAIDEQMKSFMKLGDGHVPLADTYWQDQATYAVYFYDDTGTCRVYENGMYTRSFDFEYPYLHEDTAYGHVQTVSSPIAIVSINAGRPRFRLGYFQAEFNDVDVKQTASYIWDEHS